MQDDSREDDPRGDDPRANASGHDNPRANAVAEGAAAGGSTGRPEEVSGDCVDAFEETEDAGEEETGAETAVPSAAAVSRSACSRSRSSEILSVTGSALPLSLSPSAVSSRGPRQCG